MESSSVKCLPVQIRWSLKSKVRKILFVFNLFVLQLLDLRHLLSQALKADSVFRANLLRSLQKLLLSRWSVKVLVVQIINLEI